jgi:hypothetical protein
MGNRRKSSDNGENSAGNELIVTNTVENTPVIIGLMPSGFSVPGYPNAPLSLMWIRENGHDIESLLATGLYYPVYKEELENGTRTKSTSEDTIWEGDADERPSSDVLHESESSGGDAE